MTTIRSFIAIELSAKARMALDDLQNRLKTIVPPNSMRWTAPHNVHLTLHFLGDVASDDIERITTGLSAITSRYSPFSVTLSHLGCFPNTRRPRIVWVGLSGDTDSLVALHHDLGPRLKAAIGFRPDSRPYSPHLTIGRVKKGIPARHLSQLGQVFKQEQLNVGQLTTLKVTEISLIKSELRPTGAIYTKLSRAELKDGR
jgi:2'-5' RNA ligase